MPQEFTAVPAARSSDKAFRVKQGLVIGAVLAAAAMGPIAVLVALTSRVNVPLLEAQVTQNVAATSVRPDGMLATAELVARSWAAGTPLNVPRLSNVTLTAGSLRLSQIERVSYHDVPLAEAGLSPERYVSAWRVVFRALRADGSLVLISVPMAITKDVTATLNDGSTLTVPGTSLLRAAPALEPFTYPGEASELGRGDVLVPAGWEPVTVADTAPIVSLATRWAQAYLADRLAATTTAELDPAADKNTDGLDDILAPPPPALQEHAQKLPEVGAYQGIGGLRLRDGSLRIVSGPYKPTAANTSHVGEVLLTVTFEALGSDPAAPNLNPVTMTMDLLVKAESNTVLAWGPSGSGASLTAYRNHTAYRAWLPPALGE